MIRVYQYIIKNLNPINNNVRKYLSNIQRCLTSSCKNNSAGIIIIGDEILKAQIQDTNSYFICKLLYECGVKVEKISVISDNVDEIADEIRYFSKRYTFVITSGGIGPTHDDMTYRGLAKAFNDSLDYHPVMMNIVKELYNTCDKTFPGSKLAYIPTKSELKFGKNEKGQVVKFPCINIDNVYVFPGSPIYLQATFQGLYKEIFNKNKTFITKELYLNEPEHIFANALSSVAEEFPNVKIGSYPVSGQINYKVRLTIESEHSENDVDLAIDKIKSLLPENIFVNFNSNDK